MRWISIFLIFLLCCSSVFSATKTYCLTGGTKSSNLHAGFCNDDTTVAVCFDAGGEAVDEFVAQGIDVDDNGSGQVQLQFAGIDDEVVDNTGIYVNIDFDGASAYADNRYLVVAKDIDTLDIDLAWLADESLTMSVWIGGAVPIVDATYELQDVLDDTTIGSAAAQNVDILIAGSDTATATIVADAGGGAITGTLKRLIGTNTGYVDDGTLAVISAGTADLAGTPVFQVDDISYITFKNIHVNMTGDAATAGEDCFQVANAVAQVAINFYNCKATDGYRGFNYDGDAANRMSRYELIDCTSTGSIVEGIRLTGNFWTMDRCYVEASSPYAVYSSYTESDTTDCIINGGDTGLWYNSSGQRARVTNCSFYNQTVSCIGAPGTRDVGLTAYNNLFWVTTIAADFPILNTAGVIYMVYEDWNFTNADPNSASMLTGANSDNTLWSDTETNLWADAANNDFTVVDAAMIDGGKPTLSDEGGSPADGYSTQGAAQLAQTQAGNGGGYTPPKLEGEI